MVSKVGAQAVEIMSNRNRMDSLPELEPGTPIHFVGIGGIGVSGLARICLEMGCRVTGSDRAENAQIQYLQGRGATICIGEDPGLVDDSRLVVYSSAVPATHQERIRAESLGLPTIRRGTLLALVANRNRLLAVAGTHGKSSTSAMLALALRKAGLDPTVIIGGTLPEIGGNACLGSDDYCVAESDESDGSFLELDPYLAIVTNVEDDHLEHYGNLSMLRNAFAEFIASVEDPGRRILCGDCPHLYAMARRELGEGFLAYGFSDWCDVRGVEMRFEPEGSFCRVLLQDETLGHLRIQVPGRHMLSNALGVYAACFALGLAPEEAARGLAAYRGIGRRFEILGRWRGATLIDDYAHHPTEIRATLQALRQYTEGRCVAVFQPHRFSRTDQLFHEFAKTFAGVNLLVLTEVYPAGEPPRPGVSSKHLMPHIEGVEEIVYAPDLLDVEEALKARVADGDAVLFLGAGNVNQVAFRLLAGSR